MIDKDNCDPHGKGVVVKDDEENERERPGRVLVGTYTVEVVHFINLIGVGCKPKLPRLL